MATSPMPEIAQSEAEPQSGQPLVLVKRESKPEGVLFVHTVRFWSMVAVIANHCIGSVGLLHVTNSTMMIWLIQPFKFGTIGFFLIAGFLMGKKMPSSKPVRYWKRRLHHLLKPWVFWFLPVGVYMLMSEMRRYHLHVADVSVSLLSRVAMAGLFHSTLWFVPNLLLGMACVLLLRRMPDVWTGLLLLTANLVSVANLYGRWWPTDHTEALFGFIFYLWLGTWCARRPEKMQRWIASLPIVPLLVGIGLAALVAVAESLRLLHTLPGDALNTLRLSNQIYSLLIVIALVRIRSVSWPRWVDVRAQTFGLYLAHSTCLVFAVSVMRHVLPGSMYAAGGWMVVPQAICLFVLTYGACVVLTNGLLATRGLEWMVGGEKRGIALSIDAQERKVATPTTTPFRAMVTR